MKHSSTETFEGPVRFDKPSENIPGPLYEVTPFLADAINQASSGPLTIDIQTFHGWARWEQESNVPGRPLMFAMAGNGSVVYVSADHGQTWFQWHGQVAGSGTGMYVDLAAAVTSTGPEAIVGFDTRVIGLADLGSATGTPSGNSLEHTFSDLVGSNGKSIRVGYDRQRDGWWAAGKPAGSDELRVARRPASVAIDSPGVWTELTTAGSAQGARCIECGPYGTGVGTALVVATGESGRYYYLNATSSLAPTIINVSAFYSGVIRSVVYNPYWQTYMFCGPGINSGLVTPTVLTVPKTALGSTTASDYTMHGYMAQASGAQGDDSIGLEDMGGCGAVGRWCYFQASSAISAGVAATPDMGRTWYFVRNYVLNTSNTRMDLTGVGHADGRIIMCHSSIADSTFYASITGSLNRYDPFAVAL